MDTMHAARDGGLTVRPRLAAFGPQVWSYGPVEILGVRWAAAVVSTIVGALLVAMPVGLVVYFGSDLTAIHAVTEGQRVPGHPPVVNPAPVFPAAG